MGIVGTNASIIDSFGYALKLNGQERTYKGTTYKGIYFVGSEALNLHLPNTEFNVIVLNSSVELGAFGGVNDALASALFLTNVVNMEAGENGMLGRTGDLPREMQPHEFALYVKECLRASGVRFCDAGKPIRRVAVGGGACGKMMDSAIAKGADAFVIGDCSYDLMQRAQSLGLTLVDAGHFPTENPVAAVFADKISEAFPQLTSVVSERHADCIQFV